MLCFIKKKYPVEQNQEFLIKSTVSFIASTKSTAAETLQRVMRNINGIFQKYICRGIHHSFLNGVF